MPGPAEVSSSGLLPWQSLPCTRSCRDRCLVPALVEFACSHFFFMQMSLAWACSLGVPWLEPRPVEVSGSALLWWMLLAQVCSCGGRCLRTPFFIFCSPFFSFFHPSLSLFSFSVPLYLTLINYLSNLSSFLFVYFWSFTPILPFISLLLHINIWIPLIHFLNKIYCIDINISKIIISIFLVAEKI